jgi:hypothetical protein
MLALVVVLIPVLMIASLAYIALRRSGTERTSSAMLTPLAFDARALVGKASGARQRHARLLLADGKITVTADDGTRTLHSIHYGEVISISYSRGRDPMWNSPERPARLARTGGGNLLEKLDGLFVDPHWIALRTEGKKDFVILRVEDEQVRRVLAALEERTGQIPDRVPAR